MSSYNPPIENVSIFDTLLFTDDDTALTKSEADKFYLKYPNAQGTENLQAINVAGVSTFNNKIVQNLGSSNQQFGDSLNLSVLTNGIGNQVIGTHSGTSITSGDYNTCIGYYAGDSISTGNDNIAIGKSSQHINNGSDNIAIGYESLFGQTTSVGAIAIGSDTMKSSNDNYNNSVAIGSNAMETNSGLYKYNSVAIGKNAGQNNQNSSCVAVGEGSGNGNQGEYCVAVGRAAGFNNQGDGAVAIGYASCQTSEGIDSIGIGNGCECIGINGICIGARAGKNGCGDNSIIIGSMSSGLNQSNTNARNIIINATGVAIAPTSSTDRCYITPIRSAIDIVGNNFMMQNSAGTEVIKISKTNIAGPLNITNQASASSYSQTIGNAANPVMSFITTDAGNSGAYIEVYKNSVSPASSDDIGGIAFSSTDSLGVKQLYSRIYSVIEDPITATVNGSIFLQCKYNGTDTNYINIQGADDTIRFGRSGSIETARILSNGCLDIAVSALSGNSATRLYVNGDIENIGANTGLWLNGTNTPYMRMGNNVATTNGGANNAFSISNGILYQECRGAAATSGYIWRIANNQNTTNADALQVLRLQVGTAVLAGGGTSIVTFGNTNNSTAVGILGTLSANDKFIAPITFDPCKCIPFNNSVGGNVTIKTQSFDLIQPPDGIVVATNTIIGTTLNITNNTTYTGMQIIITAVVATSFSVGVYTTSGTRLATGTLTSPYTLNRPTNITFSSPLVNTDSRTIMVCLIPNGDLTIRTVAFPTTSTQLAVVNTFNLRGWAIFWDSSPLPTTLTGTPTAVNSVPWISLY